MKKRKHIVNSKEFTTGETEKNHNIDDIIKFLTNAKEKGCTRIEFSANSLIDSSPADKIDIYPYGYEKTKPECLKCKHCGPVAFGSGHHRTCEALSDDLINQMMLVTAIIKDKETGEDAVKQNPHGVKNGWCTWPINFDPIWIDSCIFYQKKEEK